MSGNRELFDPASLVRRLRSGELPLRSAAVAAGKTAALFLYTTFYYIFRVRKLAGPRGQGNPTEGLRTMTVWCRSLLARMRISSEISGTPPRQPEPELDATNRRGLLLVCNHRSYLDVPVMGSQISTFMIGAAFARDWPVLGPGGALVGVLYVDRTSPESRKQIADTVADRLNRGYAVLNFPEGANFSGEGMAPFKTGLFRLVAGMNVDLVPVVLRYPPGVEWVGENQAELAAGLALHSQRRLSMIEHVIGLLSGPPFTVKVHFEDPIPCEQHPDPDALVALVRQKMLDRLAVL